MAYSLMDKLRQLADAKMGDPVPAFIMEEGPQDYAVPLAVMAKEAIAEIERLKLITGDPADGGG